MDLSQSPSPSNQKRARRKKKDDSDSRKHICQQCGKSYLSYSALYTHIKIKHKKQSTLEHKQINQNLQKKNSKSKQKLQQFDKQEQLDEKIIISNAVTFFSKKFPKDNGEIQNSQFVTSNNQLNTVIQIIQKNFSLINMDKSHQQFIDRIVSYWKNKQIREELNGPSETDNTSIDYVLGRFLSSLISKVSERAIKFLMYFVIAFYQGVNKIKRNEMHAIQHTFLMKCPQSKFQNSFKKKSFQVANIQFSKLFIIWENGYISKDIVILTQDSKLLTNDIMLLDF